MFEDRDWRGMAEDVGRGHENDGKRKRREFRRWDLAAHWRTDVATLVFIGFAAACLFGIQSKAGIAGAVAFGFLAGACAVVPRRDVSAKGPFGSFFR
ncbi:MAG TPA: hypothetical protein VF545_12470, partial [Thermoleophilaceae bacterium]